MQWGRKSAIAIAVVAFFVSSVTNYAQAADHRTVGMATNVVSPAEVQNEPAAVGTLAHMNDELRTGAKARLQVSFRDKTELTLGENARVVVDRFVFDPDAGTGEALINTGVGAFRLATGAISRMKNKEISVKTPFATIGVRGTGFWWGPIDGQFGVLLLTHSKLEVRNDAGSVLIYKAGYGTEIDGLKGSSGAPSPPHQWSPDKVARAPECSTPKPRPSTL